MSKKPRFIHLHTHSHYSLLEGLSKIKDLVKVAKKDGAKALALTDHGNMYGAIEFYKTCKKEGIKPIIGVDFYVAPDGRHQKRSRIDNERHHLVLLAKNETGYKNLIKLVTIGYLEGFYYKPRVDDEVLKEHSEGLICLSGDFRSELSKALKREGLAKAKEVVAKYQDIYGPENYYIEIMHHPHIENAKEVFKKSIELSKETGAPLVAGQGSYYISRDDKTAHQTLLAIQNTGFRREYLSIKSDDFSFVDSKTALEYFKEVPEAIENTEKIADACNVEIKLGEWVFPSYPIPEGSTADEELRKLTYAGLEERGMKKTKEVEERIEYELDVICRKGYSVYFLIVADLLRHAHENKIYTNIRGSVAGSIVSYLTKITSLDPIKYKLVFERFLNPDRPSAPDIDMDFADDRRDEMLDYAREKYGTEKVAQIGTFGKMLAKGVIRDVARAQGYPYEMGDRISKLIPLGKQGFPMTIERALKEEPDFKKLYKEDEEAQEIIDLGKKLEGSARHISIHAAGVVISPTELTDFVPIQYDPKGGKIITQYSMYDVEDAGLIKFDFLGLKNLSILADAVNRVEAIRGEKIDLDQIPMDDKKTFDMLARGETAALFQLNGAGMTRFLKELKPTTIHDINAMVALYRPGPMEFIPEYIKRKHNPKLVDYPHESMKESLENSFGLLIYQEDVMMTAIKLANYSWLEADKFRKAMGKKIPELMAEQEERFKSGCIENGIPEKTAKDLWERIKPFASYAFNKAHSASYGRVAYHTAYMKANYPAEYMTAVLTADSGDVEKIADLVDEVKRMGFQVLPPDVNESFSDFTVVVDESGKITDTIRFGLRSIKNFGEEIGNAIIAERKHHGKYQNYSDFLKRVQNRNMNKKSLEALILSGALDSFGHNRGTLLHNLDDALAFNRSFSRADAKIQTSLMGFADNIEDFHEFEAEDAEDLQEAERLRHEKELLGLYISGHPLEKWREKIEQNKNNIESISEMKEGEPVIIAGIIEDVKVILTKKNSKMAFIRVADFSGAIESVAFPETFENFRAILEKDNCVALKGKVSHRNDEPSILIDKVKILE